LFSTYCYYYSYYYRCSAPTPPTTANPNPNPNPNPDQVLSANATDHSFALHKDKTFKPLVKGKPGEKATAAPKIGANDPCSCGSGKKYKKCCMNK